MTVEEVFSHLSAHLIEGLMIHAQLSDYYNFLGLKGYSKCHEYHFYCESKSYRKVSEYYITHYNKLIPSIQVPDPQAIPANWIGYVRKDVDINTRKIATEAGFDKWVQWEFDTKNMYEEFYRELITLGDVASANFILELIVDVSEELKDAQQFALENKAIDYDMSVIIDKQDELFKKCKHMIKGD